MKRLKTPFLNFLALPDGWYRINGSTLKPVLERKTWGEARRYCQSVGADLASISSESEDMFIREMLPDVTSGKITTECLLCSKGFPFIYCQHILWIRAAHCNQPGVDPENLESEGRDPKFGKRGPENGI